MLGSASTWGNRQSRKCNIFKRISFPSETTKWTINMNFIHNKVWSKVSQVQRLLQQPHAFLLLRCHTHTFTFHFGSQTFILDIASHFSNDLTTNLYRGSSWLGRNRALEVIKMSICIQITQKKNKKMQIIHYLQNICPFFKWACYKISSLSFLWPETSSSKPSTFGASQTLRRTTLRRTSQAGEVGMRSSSPW